MATAIASATDTKNSIVTRNQGIRGDSGTDGTDGAGFDQVRETLLANPIVKVLAPNYPAVVGFDNLTWNRASAARGFNKYGQLASANIDIPRETINGWYIEGQGTNLLLNSDAPVTQDISVSANPHTLSFFGTGTITLSGAATGTLVGTGATDRVDLAFTPATGTLTVTITGSVEYAQIEQFPFATSYITSEGVAGVRSPDIVTMPAFNNTPLLSEDFSVFFRVYFDGFTGGEDFVFSLPNGVNTDNLTVCAFCDDGLFTFRVSDGTTSADCTTTLVAKTEYTICLRKSGSLITLDLDATQVDTVAHSITVPTGTSGIVKIGGNEAGTSKNLFGKIYDFRIYDFLLNDSEAQFLAEV